MTRPMLVSCAVAALLATAHEAVAQTPHVQLSVGGGVATDARGITSRAATVAPSLAWSVDPRLSLGIAASGTRYQDAQWSLGGSATASARVPLGALVALTFDGAGAATTTSFDAAFQTLDAIPALELHVGPVAAFAGAHAAYGRSSLVAQATTPFGAIPGTTRATGSARTATGPVFGGSARLTSASEMLMAIARSTPPCSTCAGPTAWRAYRSRTAHCRSPAASVHARRATSTRPSAAAV